MLSLLTALLLSQVGPTMAGPAVRPLNGYSSTLLFTNPAVECAGAALTASMGEVVSVTRASAAFCTKTDGTLVSVATGSPRVSNAGLLIEGGRTNSVIRSQTMGTGWNTANNVTFTDDDIAAPDGTTTAERLNVGAAAAQNHMTLSTAITETINTWSRSVYFKAGTVPHVGIGRDNSVGEYATMNLTTGVLGNTAGGARTQIQSLVSSWYRLAWVYVAASQLGRQVYIHIGDTEPRAHPQPTSWTSAGTENIYAWGAQAEVGAFPSSYVPTVATAVARAADNVSFVPGSAMTTTGCVSGTVVFGILPPADARIIGGAVATGIYVVDADTVAIGDGTNTVSVDPGALASQSMSFLAKWTGSSLTLTVNGVTATGSFDGDMDMGTLYLGSQAGSSNFLFGHLRSIKVSHIPGECI